MLCEKCGDRQATVHLTEIIEGQVRKIHLCEECAEQGGMNIQEPSSIPDLLLSLGVKTDLPAGEDTSCPVCHMRRSDFRKTSRLGCPVCYETFRADLEVLLGSLHRGTAHVGKAPPAVATAPEAPPPDVSELQRQLDFAVKSEKFEEAARLRDLIRARQIPGKPGPADSRVVVHESS